MEDRNNVKPIDNVNEIPKEALEMLSGNGDDEKKEEK